MSGAREKIEKYLGEFLEQNYMRMELVVLRGKDRFDVQKKKIMEQHDLFKVHSKSFRFLKNMTTKDNGICLIFPSVVLKCHTSDSIIN